MSDDFLSRWSRRKRAAQHTGLQRRPDETPSDAAGVPDSLHEPAPAEDAKNAVSPEAELGEEEIARLPPLGELTADSDLSMFLRKGVPESLRNAALRRMWSLDPKIRDYVSEAREYAYDWNTPGGVPGFGGPLPPPEEIQKMAARIVGVFDPGTEPRGEAAEPWNSETSDSQSGESSGVEAAPGLSTGASPADDATVSLESPPIAKPLESLRLDPPRRPGSDFAASHDHAATQQEPREQPEKLSRPPRHGGAMPV
jgi:hypothetical protein